MQITVISNLNIYFFKLFHKNKNITNDIFWQLLSNLMNQRKKSAIIKTKGKRNMINKEIIDDMFNEVLEDIEYAKLLSYLDEIYQEEK